MNTVNNRLTDYIMNLTVDTRIPFLMYMVSALLTNVDEETGRRIFNDAKKYVQTPA